MSGQNTGQPYAVELLADIRRALGAGHRPKLSALADIVAGLMAEHEALEKVEQAARERRQSITRPPLETGDTSVWTWTWCAYKRPWPSRTGCARPKPRRTGNDLGIDRVRFCGGTADWVAVGVYKRLQNRRGDYGR